MPFEIRRRPTNTVPTSTRDGMLESLSLGIYLLLVDYINRRFRTGNPNLNAGATEIFEGITARAITLMARLAYEAPVLAYFPKHFFSRLCQLVWRSRKAING